MKLQSLAKELKAISQTGLTYTKDKYDQERYVRLQELSHELIANIAQCDIKKVNKFFLPEKGYPTPKVDLRAAIFKNNKILLVKEKADKRWTLPGGWADTNETPKEGIEREVFEESGYKVKAIKLAAVIDRDKYQYIPKYPFHIYKFFFICEITGGYPIKNIEISEIKFFGKENLPPLSEARVLQKDILRMYEYKQNMNLETYFD